MVAETEFDMREDRNSIGVVVEAIGMILVLGYLVLGMAGMLN
jgi:hypothetical protein